MSSDEGSQDAEGVYIARDTHFKGRAHRNEGECAFLGQIGSPPESNEHSNLFL